MNKAQEMYRLTKAFDENRLAGLYPAVLERITERARAGFHCYHLSSIHEYGQAVIDQLIADGFEVRTSPLSVRVTIYWDKADLTAPLDEASRS